MKYFISIIALIFSLSAQSYPKIDIIKDNSNYLLVNEESLPIIDVGILFAFGSKNDSSKKGITNFSFELLHQQVMNNKKFINMNELDTFENAFLIFTNAISNFENQLEKTDYKQEDIKLLVFQTKNKLKNLYQDISDELDRVEQLKNF